MTDVFSRAYQLSKKFEAGSDELTILSPPPLDLELGSHQRIFVDLFLSDFEIKYRIKSIEQVTFPETEIAASELEERLAWRQSEFTNPHKILQLLVKDPETQSWNEKESFALVNRGIPLPAIPIWESLQLPQDTELAIRFPDDGHGSLGEGDYVHVMGRWTVQYQILNVGIATQVFAPVQKTVGLTSQKVVPENLNRTFLSIVNPPTNLEPIFLSFGATAIIDAGVPVYPGAGYEWRYSFLEPIFSNSIFAVSRANQNVILMEGTSI